MNQESLARNSRQRMFDASEQPQEHAQSKPVQDAGFQFLNFSNFHDTKAKETISRVRSHVMRGVHQSKKGQRRSRTDEPIELDTSALPQPTPQSIQQLAEAILPDAAVAGPSRLGSGRNDPFQQYPIEMNQRNLELYDHLRGDFCPMFKTLSKIGFFRSITDPAGFLQILCTSVSHMTTSRRLPVTESPEATVLSLQAIQSVNNRLADPVLNTSDGVVVAVLAFSCHTIMFNDVPGSETHLKGLEEIIRRRGGLSTLVSKPAMRMVLFWVDTNYAFMTDSVPQFPSPDDLLPEITAWPPHSAPMLLADTSLAEDLTLALHALYGVNQLIISEAETRDIWADGVFAWNYVLPVLYNLLLTKYEQPRPSALRAGAVLYIAAIRRRFRVRFLTHTQIRNLKSSMTVLMNEIEPFGHDPSIWLWLLVLGSTLSSLKEDQEWFVSHTAQHIIAMGYGSWSEVIGEHVQKVLWIDELVIQEREALRQKLSTTIWNSYGREFA